MNDTIDIVRTLGTLDRRVKRLDGYSYKLTGNQFGMDVILPEKMDLDENQMSVWIPFADGNRRDGVGDLLEVGGIRTDRHRVNPIVLFDHGKQVTLPIGLAEDPDTGVYMVEIDPVTRSARAKAYFYQGQELQGIEKKGRDDHALFCEQLFDLMAKRYVRGGSIGYQVVKALQLQPDYETGTPQGLHLLVTLMLECSAVVMPANQDTVRKALDLPKVCGKPLSPMLVKSLSPYAGERKAQLGYEGNSTALVAPEEETESIFVSKPCDFKSIRMKYRKKAKARYENISGFQPGDKVAARSLIMGGHGTTVTTFARPGEKLTVISYQNGLVEVRNSSGQVEKVTGTEIRKVKSQMVDNKEVIHKSLDITDIRRKYKTTKGLRRRLKRSQSGSSIIHVHEKDLGLVRKTATEKGLKCQCTGTHPSGLMKVKLTGDDGTIDGVAKQFGRPLKKVGMRGNKSLTEKGKNMPGEMRRKVKAAPEGMGNVPPEEEPELIEGDEMEGEQKDLEPYGAQVLRRLHEDCRILMGEYDEMMGPLEHEPTRDHLHSKLEQLERDLSEIEDLWEGHYGEKSDHKLPGLEGSMKDMEGEEEETPDETEEEDGDVLEADSEEEEEPTEDEVVEGMESKRLRGRHTKNLRRKYGSKAMSSQQAAQYLRQQEPLLIQLATSESWNPLTDKLTELFEDVGFEGGSQRARMEVGRLQNDATPKKRQISQMIRAIETVLQTQGKNLRGRKAMSSQQAAQYLRRQEPLLLQLATSQSWNPLTNKLIELFEEIGYQGASERARMEVGRMQASATPKRKQVSEMIRAIETFLQTQGKNLKGKKDFGAVDEMDQDVNLNEPGEKCMKALEPEEKEKVGEACKYLKDLTQEQNFGEEQRQKAYHFHKSLDDMSGMKDMTTDAAMGGAEQMVEGVADGKGMDEEKKKGLVNPMGMTGGMSMDVHPHRTACKSVSGFMKELSQEKAFGEPHRMKAMEHHQMLSKALEEDEQEKDFEEMDEQDATTEVNEPGEMDMGGMGEKRFKKKSKRLPPQAVKKLKKTFIQQNKQLGALADRLKNIGL